MNISVWDTYVKRENNKIMHFDILVNSNLKEKKIVFEYGKKYLKSKQFKTETITAKKCKFCHIEQANKEILDSILAKGYYIIEMENCN